jgi:lipooligosaccharide transport system permease protein
MPDLRLALTLWRRNARVFSRSARGYLLPLFLDPVLYLLALGFGLGTYVGTIAGIPYREFIAPGLCASAAMWAASFETTWNLHYKVEESRQFDALLTTPAEVQDVVLGELLWGATRAAVYGSAFLVVIAVLGYVDSPWALALPPAIFLGGACFAAAGIAFTSLIPKSEYYTFYFTLVITPMFLFGGIFYPYDELPGWAQTAAWLTPLYHLVELSRGLARAPDPSLLLDALWLAVVTAALFVVPVWGMRRRLVA